MKPAALAGQCWGWPALNAGRRSHLDRQVPLGLDSGRAGANWSAWGPLQGTRRRGHFRGNLPRQRG